MLPKFKSIFDLLQAFPNEQACIDYLEKVRWKGNIVSPFDETSKVYKCAGNKYKCKNTGKYFNVNTATIFENTKIPLVKWFMALYMFSSHKKVYHLTSLQRILILPKNRLGLSCTGYVMLLPTLTLM